MNSNKSVAQFFDLPKIDFAMKRLFALAALLPLHANAFAPSPLRLTENQYPSLENQRSAFFPLCSITDENESVEVENSAESDLEKSNFDGEGFAGYLAPYALALVASIAVTAAFVKFVLLDY